MTVSRADEAASKAALVDDPATPVAPDGGGRPATGLGAGLIARARAVLPPLVVLAVPLVVICVSFWPGHMSADTLVQIEQSRSGDLTNQHAPVLIALWGVGWDLFNAGPGWVLAMQVIVFLAGAYVLLREILRPLLAALITDLIAFAPPVFGMLGYISRDVWFTGLLLLTFGLVMRAAQRDGRARAVYLVLGVLAAWFTLASRQNAAPSVVVACIAIAALALPAWRLRPWIAAALAGVAITVALMGTQFAANAALDVRDVAPQQQLYIYDLAGISREERSNLFPPDVLPQRGMGVIDAHWNVDTVGPFVFGPTAPTPWTLPEPQGSSLSEAWREAIVDHPFDYLEVRWDLWLRQIAIGRPAEWIYHPDVGVNNLNLEIRFPDANNVAKDYVEAFAKPGLQGGIVHTVWAYLLLCAVAAVLLLRRVRPPAMLIAGGLALSAVTYQPGIFAGAMATQYRWEFSVVVTALVVAVFLVRLPWHARRATPAPPT